jgi:hypothetical protein
MSRNYTRNNTCILFRPQYIWKSSREMSRNVSWHFTWRLPGVTWSKEYVGIISCLVSFPNFYLIICCFSVKQNWWIRTSSGKRNKSVSDNNCWSGKAAVAVMFFYPICTKIANFHCPRRTKSDDNSSYCPSGQVS